MKQDKYFLQTPRYRLFRVSCGSFCIVIIHVIHNTIAYTLMFRNRQHPTISKFEYVILDLSYQFVLHIYDKHMNILRNKVCIGLNYTKYINSYGK